MLKINYDDTGKVQEIYIQISGSWVLVPWNFLTKSINWDSIDYEPTRNAIKSAWDAWAVGKDLTVELRDRPDLAVSQLKTPPDWANFNKSFLVDPGYLRIISQNTVPVLISRLEILSIAANKNLDIMSATWNTIVSSLSVKPSPNEIYNWNKLADENYMDFYFANDGTFTID